MENRTAIIKQPDKISSFNDVYQLQKEYQEGLISDNSNPDFIWIGEHQLCYTLGRGSNYDNLLFSLNDDKYNVFKDSSILFFLYTFSNFIVFYLYNFYDWSKV